MLVKITNINFFQRSATKRKRSEKDVINNSNIKTKKEKEKDSIEVDPNRTILIQRLKPTLPIGVLDKETQERFPSLLVSPTVTVRREEIGLLRDSEQKMQHDK